jgi:hypothetical protein
MERSCISAHQCSILPPDCREPVLRFSVTVARRIVPVSLYVVQHVDEPGPGRHQHREEENVMGVRPTGSSRLVSENRASSSPTLNITDDPDIREGGNHVRLVSAKPHGGMGRRRTVTYFLVQVL